MINAMMKHKARKGELCWFSHGGHGKLLLWGGTWGESWKKWGTESRKSWGKTISGRRNRKCTNPEAEMSFASLKSGKKATVSSQNGRRDAKYGRRWWERGKQGPGHKSLLCLVNCAQKSLKGFGQEDKVNKKMEEYRKRRIPCAWWCDWNNRKY